MKILAIDTTSRRGGLALAVDGQVTATADLVSESGLAGVLYPEIERLLHSQRLTLADLDAFAAAAGPGSFTGVRIGLTAIKALAEACGKLALPVSNLLALAAAGEGPARAAVMDARRNEVYGAVYSDRLEPLVGEMVGPWESFLEAAARHEPSWTTSSDQFPLPSGAPHRIVTALAEPVARVASRRLAEGGGLLPERVEANYIRRPDAERNWERLQKRT